jgi:hypothetical protein
MKQDISDTAWCLHPIGDNGWPISTTSPRYKLSFDRSKTVVQKAEAYRPMSMMIDFPAVIPPRRHIRERTCN